MTTPFKRSRRITLAILLALVASLISDASPPPQLKLKQLLVTGQSLSLGSRGFISDEQGEVQFKRGVSGTVLHTDPTRFGDKALAFAPNGPRAFIGPAHIAPRKVSEYVEFQALYETFDGVVLGETLSSGFAKSALAKDRSLGIKDSRYLFTISGAGGVRYAALKRGTSVFQSAINSVVAARRIASDKGWAHEVIAIHCVHGESESDTTQADYYQYLKEWATEYQQAIGEITKQPKAPYFFIDQLNSFTASTYAVALAQLQAHQEAPNIVLVGPKYQYPYYDSHHMLAEGYVKQGEYLERAVRETNQGVKWEPLRPTKIHYNGERNIEITMLVPIPPLTLDTTAVSDPGDFGFTCTDPKVSITEVSIEGSKVNLRLSSKPTEGASIQYASQTQLSESPGRMSGARGNLRDSDQRMLSSFDHKPLYNWCVAFSLPLVN